MTTTGEVLKPCERFLQRIEKSIIRIPESGCWIWMGSVNSRGYGTMSWGGKWTTSHREMYRKIHGDIGEGLFVCHSCDVKCCINPDHLSADTPSSNVQDALSRKQFPIGSRNGMSVLDEEKVFSIKTELANGVGIKTISERDGISWHTLRDIRRGRRWGHVLVAAAAPSNKEVER